MSARAAALLAVLAVLAAGPAFAQPTPEEQAAIDGITKLRGTATVDTDLPPEARLVAKFEKPTDTTFAALKKFPQVGVLDAFDCTLVTDNGFAPLKDLPHLRKLVVGKSAATDRGFGLVCDCKELRTLYFAGSPVTDIGLFGLKKLKHLETLDLNGNKRISDKGLPHVAACPRLDELFLNDTSITDKGLPALLPLEGLRRLSVANTKVTDAAADKLTADMPNLRAVRR